MVIADLGVALAVAAPGGTCSRSGCGRNFALATTSTLPALMGQLGRAQWRWSGRCLRHRRGRPTHPARVTSRVEQFTWKSTAAGLKRTAYAVRSARDDLRQEGGTEAREGEGHRVGVEPCFCSGSRGCGRPVAVSDWSRLFWMAWHGDLVRTHGGRR